MIFIDKRQNLLTTKQTVSKIIVFKSLKSALDIVVTCFFSLFFMILNAVTDKFWCDHRKLITPENQN